MSESRLGWPWPRWPLEHATNGVGGGGHDDGRVMVPVVAIVVCFPRSINLTYMSDMSYTVATLVG